MLALMGVWEYLVNNNPYEDAVIPNFIIEYLKKYTKKEYNYIVTHIGSKKEYELKKEMILRNYGNYFYPTHSWCGAGDSKISVIKDVLRTHHGGLDVKHSLNGVQQKSARSLA